MKRLAVFGICGKMGVSMTRELLKESCLEVAGGFDRINVGHDIGIITGGPEAIGKKVYGNYEDIKKLKPDLILDFTNAEISFKSICWAIENSIDIIVGSTGFKKDEIDQIENKANSGRSRVFLVPNFSIGAVIAAELSAIAAKYFEYCEIIELHHNKKKDSPSGTSILTAQKISKAVKFGKQRLYPGESETIRGSRGAFTEGVHIHSVRLPGLLAHQEVIFGAMGQTLSIRHDSIDRLTFYPGVILAIGKIGKLNNFTYGLDKILEIR